MLGEVGLPEVNILESDGEALYLKKTGKYFLRLGWDIKPCNENEAKNWAEENLDGDV